MTVEADLTSAGYTVGEAFQLDGGEPVLSVEGYGIKTYLRGGDADATASLLAYAREQSS